MEYVPEPMADDNTPTTCGIAQNPEPQTKLLGKTPEARARSLANLRYCEKGTQPPNQRGRPRTKAISDDIRRWLQRRDKGERVQRKEVLFRRLLEVRPDVLAAYAWGKPLDRVELSGPDGGPITLDTGLLAAAQALARSIALGEALPAPIDVTPNPLQINEVANDGNRTDIVHTNMPEPANEQEEAQVGGAEHTSTEATVEGGNPVPAYDTSPSPIDAVLEPKRSNIQALAGGRAKAARVWDGEVGGS
jgi:hypothetical protein